MNPPDPNSRPADGPEIPQCARCGMPAVSGGTQCPACLLRLTLEFGRADTDNSLPLFDEPDCETAEYPRPRRFARYEILEEIGRGGMGIIYRARHEESGQIVALKCLLDFHADSPETVARFRREAASAAMLHHRHILPVYEVGNTADGLPFFSMLLALGGSLHRQGGVMRRDPREAANLIYKIATGVQFAHEQGILHRDLKPGNILLDATGEPFVSDFGLAKWLHDPDGLTRTLLVFGTPGYIAPEQAHGPEDLVGPAADVYSLGAILFELLTGRPPFIAEHTLAVLKKASEEQAPSVRAYAPQVDREMETICARCLEREPSARYATAGELAADLGRWLGGERITARRAGRATLMWRSSRRNPLLTAAMIAALLCASFAAVYFINNGVLRRAAEENLLAQRSAVVLPVLELDTATTDAHASRHFAAGLGNILGAIAPARVTHGGESLQMTALNQRALAETAAATHSRLVIALTKRRLDGGVQFSARVFDAATAQPLLVHSWQSPSTETDAMEWAKSIAPQLNAVMSRADAVTPAGETDAGMQDAEVRYSIEAGRRLMFRQTVGEIDQAIALFEKALVAQPRSAKARAYLASSLVGKTYFKPDDELAARAENEARKAVELAPHLQDARRALAGVLFERGDFAGALEQLMQTAEACGVDVNLARFIAQTFDHLGSLDRALGWCRLALAAEERPERTHAAMGDYWAKLHDDDRALEEYGRAAELQPGLSPAVTGMARVHLLRGDFARARESNALRPEGEDFGFSAQLAAQIQFFARDFAGAERLYRELSKRDPGGGGAFYGAVQYDSAMGRCLQELGRAAEGQRLLLSALDAQRKVLAREHKHPRALYRLAAVESSLGWRDAALQHLRAAVANGWRDYRSLQMDPRFDALRQEAAFQQVVAEMMAIAVEQRRTAP